MRRHEAAGRHFEAGGRAQLRARGGRRRAGGLPPRRARLLLPLPQGHRRAGGARACAASPSTCPASAWPTGRRSSTTRWTGLGRFAGAAVDALELDRFHLVVHDIGGPVGFELAAAAPGADPLAHRAQHARRGGPVQAPVVDGAVRAARDRRGLPAHAHQARLPGADATPGDRGHERRSPSAELDSWVDLLKRGDGGRAFLRIMRGFERTRAKRQLYAGALRDVPYPVQAVWGERRPRAARGPRTARTCAGSPASSEIHRCPPSTSSRRTRRRRWPSTSRRWRRGRRLARERRAGEQRKPESKTTRAMPTLATITTSRIWRGGCESVSPRMLRCHGIRTRTVGSSPVTRP